MLDSTGRIQRRQANRGEAKRGLLAANEPIWQGIGHQVISGPIKGGNGTERVELSGYQVEPTQGWDHGIGGAGTG